MSEINYQALREAAQLATQGEWVAFISPGKYGTYAVHTPGDNHHGDIVDWPGFDEQKNAENNARYIAAFNPEVVQALLDELEAANKRIAELEAEPVSQTYNLPELIEGMEVSIDVSTCDADLGNRYFGTVTEVSELDAAKNGYILLVQDAEPNFDVNGNSPGTPDSWISCSDRMPEKGQNVLISVNFDSSLVEPLICAARYTGSTFRRGDATIKPGNGIEQATHWMPLPEPPQEVK
ncbi:ead/Ea22-like family protein [Escherichia coli]|uniref:ead/Ea22-like family protein n=1 Tax=Escherichia coli TaxID=562 RepID=UPI000D10C986|nr:ead/Ea22-like family protein [Escherichia coli]